MGFSAHHVRVPTSRCYPSVWSHCLPDRENGTPGTRTQLLTVRPLHHCVSSPFLHACSFFFSLAASLFPLLCLCLFPHSPHFPLLPLTFPCLPLFFPPLRPQLLPLFPPDFYLTPPPLLFPSPLSHSTFLISCPSSLLDAFSLHPMFLYTPISPTTLTLLCNDSVAEWLRRLPAKQFPSGIVGSNPATVVFFYPSDAFSFLPFC